jgi:hypothetical protein
VEWNPRPSGWKHSASTACLKVSVVASLLAYRKAKSFPDNRLTRTPPHEFTAALSFIGQTISLRDRNKEVYRRSRRLLVANTRTLSGRGDNGETPRRFVALPNSAGKKPSLTSRGNHSGHQFDIPQVSLSGNTSCLW